MAAFVRMLEQSIVSWREKDDPLQSEVQESMLLPSRSSSSPRTGRPQRIQYWMTILAAIATGIVLGWICAFLPTHSASERAAPSPPPPPPPFSQLVYQPAEFYIPRFADIPIQYESRAKPMYVADSLHAASIPPWQTDCTREYSRTVSDQRSIVEQAQALHRRAQTRSGDEFEKHLAELIELRKQPPPPIPTRAPIIEEEDKDKDTDTGHDPEEELSHDHLHRHQLRHRLHPEDAGPSHSILPIPPPYPREIEYSELLRQWLEPELDRHQFKARPANLDCTRHTIVIIDGRVTPMLPFIVRHTFFLLSQDTQRWGLIIFHSKANGDFVAESLEVWPGGAGEHIQLHQLSDDKMDRNFGNKIILSRALWEMIPVENVLLLQLDGIMMKSPAADLALWHELTNRYVYVGAPFPHPSTNPDHRFDEYTVMLPSTPYGGNGGVSFRKKSVMMELSTSLKCSEPDSLVGECGHQMNQILSYSTPNLTDLEDRWIADMLYTRRAQFRGRLAFFDQSKKFSVDTIYYEDPFFTHKYWQLQPRAEGFITHKEVLHFLAPVKTWYSSADDPPPTEAPVQSREAAQTEQEPVQLQTLTPSEFERPSMEPMVARK